MATATKSKTETEKEDKKPAGSTENGSKTTTDHDVIKSWIEKRGGKPSTVKGTGNKKDGIGILRIDFPGYSGEDTLVAITWEQFFEAFEANDLEFLYQEKTANGKESHFSKFVSRVN